MNKIETLKFHIIIHEFMTSMLNRLNINSSGNVFSNIQLKLRSKYLLFISYLKKK